LHEPDGKINHARMTDASAPTLSLAADFPPASYDQWRKLVEATLKGARFEDRLLS
jgi:hypothetical protein